MPAGGGPARAAHAAGGHLVLGLYVVVGAALVTIFSWGRLLWWRGGKGTGHRPGREPISPDEEIATAAVPPA